MSINVKTAVVVLLMLAVTVLAVDVGQAETVATGFLNDVKTFVWLASLASVGILLADVIYTLLIRRRGLPELFSSGWFWVPFLFISVPIIFGVVSQFSPEVKSIYDKIVEGRCPFLYCPS
jgi:cytochrome c biogenesis protein ResB